MEIRQLCVYHIYDRYGFNAQKRVRDGPEHDFEKSMFMCSDGMVDYRQSLRLQHSSDLHMEYSVQGLRSVSICRH